MTIRELQQFAQVHGLVVHTYYHTMTYGPPWDAILRTPALDMGAEATRGAKYTSRLMLLGEKLPDWFKGDALIARRYGSESKALRALVRKFAKEIRNPKSPWYRVAQQSPLVERT